MSENKITTGESVPVAPSMLSLTEAALGSPQNTPLDRRILRITGLAIGLGAASALIAQALLKLIAIITNISFYGRLSHAFVAPGGNHLGLAVIAVPVIGGLLVGLMARYGSAGIRGHGIPEAMVQVLTNESRIPARLTILKPLSAAISIGTGGPFGAEGPIIATGGALGSLIGQVLPNTADERKTLLAAGAAAGMAATFGTPVSAVLLAIELLLFEYRPRSFIPVALASTTATGIRMLFMGAAPMFPMTSFISPGGSALAAYILIGALIGLAAVVVTKAVYWIEDLFEKLPVHWMWWPALGGIAVGVIGYAAPLTLGVGYTNIEGFLSGSIVGKAALFLCFMKFISWAISLGSGTSGGTLAPLFTIGGALGSVLGLGLNRFAPQIGIDVRIAALVGMSAIFAGASRALLTSVVFAFETTMQPLSLLPLLGGCSAAYLISSFCMRHTIMTEKIARRGIHVPSEYDADILARTRVIDICTKPAAALEGKTTLHEVRDWILSRALGSRHQGYPVVDENQDLLGIVTHRDLLDLTALPDQTLAQIIKRPPIVIYPNNTLREAADLMVQQEIGRLPVVDPENPRMLIGILTRSDLLSAHRRRLNESQTISQSIRFALKPRG
jgi:H+/Cl- antiporter ClcA/predicted transcriptional regulator